MDTSKTPRKLDVAASATIDIVALNNKVVLMRPHVRKAKYQTVQKIIRSIQVLKNKKGSEEQLEKNKRKIDRLLEDIQAIKTLRPSKVSKFALANTLTLDEICRKPDINAETRALGRLAEHQIMKNVVSKFREEHSDWKALADFLLGHISRRFFSNKYKTERIKIMTANRKAGNQLMKSYLENKIGKDQDILKKDDVESESKDEEKLTVKKENNKEDLTRKKVKTKVLQKNKPTHEVDIFSKRSDNADDSDLEKDDLDSNSESTSENSESENENSEILKSDDEIEGSENSDSEAEKQDIESSEHSDSESDSQNEKNFSDNSDSEIEQESSENNSDDNEQDESKNNSNTKMRGEMVVKKFNVDDLLNSNDAEVPSFLINQSSEENVSYVKKSKDSFFMGGDDDDDEEKSDNENDIETDGSDDENINTNRNIMNSSFIGALNEVKSRHRNFDNSRGFGRGRGHWDNFGQNRGGFQNFERRGRGFQNFERRERGFQNFERRGRGSLNFERRGRGNFQNKFRNAPQNAPKEFQRSSGRGRGNRGSFDSRQQQPGKSKDIKVHGSSSTGSIDSGKTAEKIHPSWEASKKRKEHLSIQAFQGKKIKFDED